MPKWDLTGPADEVTKAIRPGATTSTVRVHTRKDLKRRKGVAKKMGVPVKVSKVKGK